MIVAILGTSRSGKDTVSNWISEHTILRYTESTSQFGSKIVFDHMLSGGEPWYYTNAEAAWQDRHRRRAKWASVIWNYNSASESGIRLYEDMLDENDVINGIRKISELEKCRDIIDLSIWISRPGAKESIESCSISAIDCDITVHNNGTLDSLGAKLHRLFASFGVLR